ncbi:MAG: sugar transferase, partial [Pseudonocardiales bacterium]|nr:sugar transferase [Pseudonocardiales bacterium]
MLGGNVLTSLDERAPDLTVLRNYLPSPSDAGLTSTKASLRPTWAKRYRRGLVLTDLTAVGLAVGIAFILRFATELQHESIVRYLQVGIAITLGWAITVHGVGGYEIRHLSVGIQEYKYIFKSSAIVAGLIAACCYMIQFNVVRGYVALAIPVGAALLIVNR